MFPVTAVAGLLCCMPQFIPQYAFWLCPWAAIAWDDSHRVTWMTFGVLMLSSLLYFSAPEAGTTQLVIFARNILLLGVVIEGMRLMAADARRRQPTRRDPLGVRRG